MAWIDIPLEPDTTLLEEVPVRLDGYDLLYQRWNWDGLPGESLILRENQVEAVTDEQLHQLGLDKGLMPAEASTTITRPRQGYAFLNYFERT